MAMRMFAQRKYEELQLLRINVIYFIPAAFAA
jgi:hypothetical protein